MHIFVVIIYSICSTHTHPLWWSLANVSFCFPFHFFLQSLLNIFKAIYRANLFSVIIVYLQLFVYSIWQVIQLKWKALYYTSMHQKNKKHNQRFFLCLHLIAEILLCIIYYIIENNSLNIWKVKDYGHKKICVKGVHGNFFPQIYLISVHNSLFKKIKKCCTIKWH